MFCKTPTLNVVVMHQCFSSADSSRKARGKQHTTISVWSSWRSSALPSLLWAVISDIFQSSSPFNLLQCSRLLPFLDCFSSEEIATWEHFAMYSKPSSASWAFNISSKQLLRGIQGCRLLDRFGDFVSVDLSCQPCKQALTLSFSLRSGQSYLRAQIFQRLIEDFACHCKYDDINSDSFSLWWVTQEFKKIK